MSTPLQPIWLIDPIEPPTDSIPVLREPLTEVIPVQRPRLEGSAQDRPTARRSAPPPSRPRRGYRNLVAALLMFILLLGGATAAISAFLDGNPASNSSPR